MAVNYILEWLISINCVIIIFKQLRTHNNSDKSWQIICAIILIIMLISHNGHPNIAGFIAFSIWFPLVLLPLLATRLLFRLVLQERYSGAINLAKCLAILHPFGGWRRYQQLFMAFKIMLEGSRQQADKLIGDTEVDNKWMTEQLRFVCLKTHNDWQILRDELCTSEMQQVIFSEKPYLASYLLRAFGETGDLKAMIRLFLNCWGTQNLHSDQTFNALVIFAFCGKKDILERILNGPMAQLQAVQKEFWRATAAMADGDFVTGQQSLKAQLNNGCITPGFERAICYRLQTCPPIAKNVLSTDDWQQVESIQTNIANYLSYAHLGVEKQKRAVVSYALIAILCLFFFMEFFFGGTTNPNVLYHLGALWTPALSLTEIWRLISANFLHWGPVHLLMNLITLALIGPYIEFHLGSYKTLFLYIASGFAGMAVITLAYQLGLTRASLVVGASASIAGMLGAGAIVLLHAWLVEHIELCRGLLAILTLIVVLQIIFDMLTPASSFTGHVAGFVSGTLLAVILKRYF